MNSATTEREEAMAAYKFAVLRANREIKRHKVMMDHFDNPPVAMIEVHERTMATIETNCENAMSRLRDAGMTQDEIDAIQVL